MTPFRIALLGSGWISRTYLEALRDVPEGRAVAIWSRTREAARRLAEVFAVELATDRVDEAIAAADVVCVNSPNALHAEHALAAARAGKHVIVEKPLAVTLEQGEAIVDACKRAGVGLAYAEELPFAPRLVRAQAIMRAGDLGVPRYVTQREAHAGPYSPWFFTREEAGGGVLMDLMCHSVEAVCWLLDHPPVRSVTARLACLDPSRGSLEDHSLLWLAFEGTLTAYCEASWGLQGGMQSRLEIWGSEGTLAVDLLGETGLRLFRARGSAAGWSTPAADWVAEAGYTAELRHFLRCFRDGTPPEESGAEGLRVLEILCAAYASAAQQRPIDLPFRPPPLERAVDLWLPR